MHICDNFITIIIIVNDDLLDSVDYTELYDIRLILQTIC